MHLPRFLLLAAAASAALLLTSCTTTLYGIKGEYKGRPSQWTVIGRDDPEDETGSTDGWYRYKIPSEEVSNVQLTGNKWFFGVRKEDIYSFEIPKGKIDDVFFSREEWSLTPAAANRPFGF